ncbi:hypothetical protein NPIL_381981, partial [Nephila pilipes]
LHLYAIIKLEE